MIRLGEDVIDYSQFSATHPVGYLLTDYSIFDMSWRNLFLMHARRDSKGCYVWSWVKIQATV